MGCNIHAHLEVKIEGTWHHYSVPDIDRDYQLFGRLAGVRDASQTLIVEPRGIPDDATFLTRYDCDSVWGSDGHTPSWLTSIEAEKVAEWHRKLRNKQAFAMPLWGYVFGNPLDTRARYPEDARCEDVRVIFWFDN